MDAINSFVSIDFETANASRVSACSLGFAKVINGEIVDHCTFLIKPVGGFSPINMMINGITPNKVTDAPTFDALLPTLREKSCGLPLLCFTRFDVSVLEELSAYYCINYSPDLKIYDVCEFARSCPAFRITGSTHWPRHCTCQRSPTMTQKRTRSNARTYTCLFHRETE